MPAHHNFLGLDIGEKRVGIALAGASARLAAPFKTLANDASLVTNLQAMVSEQQVGIIVVGLPRGLDGQDTPQTKLIKSIASQLASQLKIEIVLQDEAGTSVQAREQLDQAGRAYEKADIDALAAVYILTDYLNTGR